MDRLPAATSMATALLALERAQATGVLHVRSGSREARLALVEGVPRALAGKNPPSDSLGARLARSGDLDPRARLASLRRAASALPVGRWLVETGAARPEAVAHALRAQLRDRVRGLLRWDGVEFRFSAGDAAVGMPHVTESVRAADLVLAALRESLEHEPLLSVRRFVGSGLVVLTPLGETLLGKSALWPDEAALVPALRAGAPVDALLGIARGSHRALRFLAALRYVRAAAPPSAGGDTYSLLLRKTRELRRTRDVATLLELEHGADDAAARRSLRRFAATLHPDRLGPDAPLALRQATSEVVVALTQAVAGRAALPR